MHSELYDFLTQFTIFKKLDEYEMEPIVEIANSKRYMAGNIVFMQHEPITDVYFIQQGKIKIYKTDYDGKEQIINVLQKDDMFPHQGFFRKGNYPAHAEVLEDAVLINIPILSFENFLLTHPEICIKMFKVLGGIIVDLQQRLEEKILYNVYDQIILLLMRLAKRNGEGLSDGVFRLTIQLTNSQLANMIGSSRETISRTLTKLKKQGFINTDHQGYLIIHYDKLEETVLR
jgi:CRP/FNR family transcriptional regulator